MKSEEVVVLGFMTIQIGTEEILLREIDALVKNTRSEPGCNNYDLLQNSSEAHRFMFYENFVNREAFDLHFAQPYTKKWIALSESHGAKFDIQFWTMLTQPSREHST